MSKIIALKQAANCLRQLAKHAKAVSGRVCLAEYRAVTRLRVALCEWEESGEDKPTELFTDEIHGALTLSHWGNPGETLKVDGNELYRLESDDSTVIFTGEQLDSVAKWWLDKRGWTIKAKARR